MSDVVTVCYVVFMLSYLYLFTNKVRPIKLLYYVC